jgi:hypothetical protein
LGERAQLICNQSSSPLIPQRDTMEVLKAYAANFDPRILGLSGSAS